MVTVEKQMECRLAGETEVLGENLPQRHFVHHKETSVSILVYLSMRPTLKAFYTLIFIALSCHNHKNSGFTFGLLVFPFFHMRNKSYLRKIRVSRRAAAKQLKLGLTSPSHRIRPSYHTVILMGKVLFSAT
jgi:hypothetical protein